MIWTGKLAGTNEVWSTSCAFATVGGTAINDQQELTDWCNAAQALWAPGTGWPGTFRSMLGALSTLEKVSAYYYPTPSGGATVAAESTGSAISGSGTVTVPFQSALVATLQTGRPGRSYRGRMYLPFLTATFNLGKINTSSITLIARATAVADFLSDTAAAASSFPGLVPSVVSKTASAVTPVTSVRVGDVMDTQRRRRDDLVESFGVSSIP